MKKASAKIRRKVTVKFYRELTSISNKLEFKDSFPSDKTNKLKRR